MHLSHAQVGFMSFLQQQCFLEGKTAIILLSLITQLTMVYILVRHNSGDNTYEAMLCHKPFVDVRRKGMEDVVSE